SGEVDGNKRRPAASAAGRCLCGERSCRTADIVELLVAHVMTIDRDDRLALMAIAGGGFTGIHPHAVTQAAFHVVPFLAGQLKAVARDLAATLLGPPDCIHESHVSPGRRIGAL